MSSWWGRSKKQEARSKKQEARSKKREELHSDNRQVAILAS
jgi:hypothetical protein